MTGATRILEKLSRLGAASSEGMTASVPPNRYVEHHDAECQWLDRHREAEALEQCRQLGGLGKALHGFGQVAIRTVLAAAEPAGDGGHDAREIEAIGAHQWTRRWRRELEDDEPPTRPQHPAHFRERLLAINQVAETEADGDGVDAGIRFVEPADVAETEVDLRLEFAGPLQHRLREIDANDAAARAGKREQLVSQLAGAGAEVQRCLAWMQIGPLSRPAPPGAVPVKAEQTIPGVVAGRDPVEHLPDLFGPRFVPHSTIIFRHRGRGLQVDPRLRRPGRRCTVIPA